MSFWETKMHMHKHIHTQAGDWLPWDCPPVWLQNWEDLSLLRELVAQLYGILMISKNFLTDQMSLRALGFLPWQFLAVLQMIITCAPPLKDLPFQEKLARAKGGKKFYYEIGNKKMSHINKKIYFTKMTNFVCSEAYVWIFFSIYIYMHI